MKQQNKGSWWQRARRGVRDGAQRFYLTLLEPRVISAIYGAVYAVVLGAGVYLAMFIPVQLAYIEGARYLMLLIASFFIIGGAGGVHTIIRGDQWAECYAVWTVVLGVFFYLVTTGLTAVITPGPMGMGVIGWLLAGVLIALRLYWILDRPHRPGSRSDRMRLRRQRRQRRKHRGN